MRAPNCANHAFLFSIFAFLICSLSAIADDPATPADILLEAHTKAFLETTNDRVCFRAFSDGSKPSEFWTTAEMMEMELDAYERTHNPKQLSIFTNLFKGFVARRGPTWQKNDFNDDIMWMVIACSRAYLMSGDKEFRDAAKANFDMCYARSWSTNLGGGLWWKTDNKSKNACVEGPGAIAAVLVGRIYNDSSYLANASNIFQWEMSKLFNAETGQVYDNIRKNGRIGERAFTYNEGTFIGAANLLGYTNEAMKAATFTMNHLCTDGILPTYGETGDAGGFNGIFARWCVRFMKDRHAEQILEPWLEKNALAAWKSRRASDNLSWNNWLQPTPDGPRNSWGCSDSVVLLQLVPIKEP